MISKKKRNNKLETLLARDASNDDENDDEMENNILSPKKRSKNAQVVIRELEENDFV